MNPKISIIVPVYKVEKYLPRCVDSILSQTFKDFECILVDDGSPDNCGKICDEYAKKDSRIIVIHKENGGLSDARNAGIDVASGDYIGFVDSDDWIHPQMYEILYNYITKFNLGFVSCNYLNVYDNDNFDIQEKYDISNEINIYNRTDVFNNFSSKNYNSKITPMVWNKLYSKSIFDKLRFEKGKINEDEYFMFPSIFLADDIGVIDHKLYYYYKSRNDSIMNSNFSPAKLNSVESILSKYKFLKNNNFNEESDTFYILYIHRLIGMYKKIYTEYPEFKKDYNFFYSKHKYSIKLLFTNSKCCNMEKLIFILFKILPKFSIKLQAKYFPEYQK